MTLTRDSKIAAYNPTIDRLIQLHIWPPGFVPPQLSMSLLPRGGQRISVGAVVHPQFAFLAVFDDRPVPRLVPDVARVGAAGGPRVARRGVYFAEG
jgi:hypothetical protein